MEFKDAKFLSAKEKETVYREWKHFVVALMGGKYGDLLEPCFKKALYNHLHLHYGFIAHYDQSGFFSEYFREPDDTMRFFNRIAGQQYPYPEMDDINGAMRDFIVNDCKDSVMAVLEYRMKESQKQLDVMRAKVLLSKHGITIAE